MNEMMFYRCEKCGNIVAVVKLGGGTLTCCGQEMTRLTANSTDASKEKHVPALVIENGKIKAAVGAVSHPMTPEHFIEWIALAGSNKIEIVNLKPGMEPKAIFEYSFGDDETLGDNDEIVPNCEANPCNFVHNNTDKKIAVYAYCNLHGLWKTEL